MADVCAPSTVLSHPHGDCIAVSSGALPLRKKVRPGAHIVGERATHEINVRWEAVHARTGPTRAVGLGYIGVYIDSKHLISTTVGRACTRYENLVENLDATPALPGPMRCPLFARQ